AGGGGKGHLRGRGGRGRVDRGGVGPERGGGTGGLRLGGIAPCAPVAGGGQLGRQQAGTAADVEDAGDGLLVGAEELVQEPRQGAVAGVDDDLVVVPCQPRVRVDRTHATPRADAQDLGLRGCELLRGEHALRVQICEVLKLGVRVARRLGRLLSVLLLRHRLLAHLLLVFGLILRRPPLVLPVRHATGYGGGGAGDDGRSRCHPQESHV